MSYLASCEMCAGKGSGGYAPLEFIASGFRSDYCGSGSYSSSNSHSSLSQSYSSINSHPSSSSSYSAVLSGYSSGLEYRVSNSDITSSKDPDFVIVNSGYKQIKYADSYNLPANITRSYSGKHNFVLQGVDTRFVGDAADISGYVEDAFRLVTGEDFPDDIIISVCSKDKLKHFHSCFGGVWSDGINGFSVNRKSHGLKSEVFVCQGDLSDVIATLGHEIGHCISAPLDTARDEEAKAFAFELAWIDAVEHADIAGLKGCFDIPAPSKNNVHDRAFEFVNSLVKDGCGALSVCFGLVSKELSLGCELR